MEDEPKVAEHTVSYAPKSSQVLFNHAGPSRCRYELFGKGADGRNRVVILCLGLLDVILLIVAVVLGIGYASVPQRSNTNSYPAAAHLITELDHLFGNHSDAMEAMQEAVNAFKKATRSHETLKVKVNEQKAVNDVYQSQLESLRRERKILQFNMSALEGTCGKCNKGFTFFNSSCYYFSFTNSSEQQKTWLNSRADCVSRGADLVVIDHPNEQTYVNHIIESLRIGFYVWENGLWIGVTEMKPEGTWLWINNVTESDQRYWMPGEPNNYHQGLNCGATAHSLGQPWETRFDANCESRLHWICEMAPK
ncbi:C-type lectin domain family 4 member K-like [Festucalex cinctus]